MMNERLRGWADLAHSSRPILQSPAEGRLVSYSLPAPDIATDTFLHLAEGQERFFWQNGLDRTVYAGFGMAAQLMAWGGGRFKEIKQKIESLFTNAVRLADQPDLASPRFFGGFAFRDDFTPDNTWSVFHPAHFILPHYQMVKTGNQTWLTINALLAEDDDLADTRLQLHEALQARLQLLAGANGLDSTGPPAPLSLKINYPMTFSQWQESINLAISQIKGSDLEKVVLSRVCELRSKERIDVCHALVYLNENYKECTRFLFEPRPYHAFYGATPELLLQTKGIEVETMALAGSMRRGRNSNEDQILQHHLLNSAKDRHEHALVVDSICRRLEALDIDLDVTDQPNIYTLSYIHHLLTPIKGRLKKETGILPLLETLHPTPALGGSPRDLALDFIRRAEPVPRGWYAAPVGWVDANMDGQFAVGIRSAVAQERRVWLYAGAGIVAESEPQKEWSETSLKFQPMFAALGLDVDPQNSAIEESI